MAVITASLIAIGAAVASIGAVGAGIATVATIGTIAAVVGGVGLALGAVGMITGNKTLTKIGTYLGAAAAGGGLGALAAGAMGLGTSAAAAAPAATEAAASTTKAVAPAATEAASSAESVINPTVGQSVTQHIPDAVTSTIPEAAAPAAQGGNSMAQGIGAATQAGNMASSAMPGAEGITPPPPPMAPTVMTPVGAGAPTVGANGQLQQQLGQNIVDTARANYAAGGGGTNIPPDKGWWGSLDPSTKVMAGLAGTQMLGQTMGGMFQGQYAGNQIQAQQEMAAQDAKLKQQQLADAERQNQWMRNNANYSTMISFKPRYPATGLAGRA